MISNEKLFIVAIITAILVSAAVFGNIEAKSANSKAKDAIVKAIGKAVEGKYSTIKLIQLSKSNVSGYVIAYNTTKAVPVPPPNPPPNPPPTPTGETTKVCLVGDLKGSTVPNMMKDCNIRIALGDCGYASDFSYCKGLKFSHCDPGNHDVSEDGSSALEKETLAYCGDHWAQPVGTSALLIGLNTNGDVNTQVNYVKSLPLSNYKTIIITSHKAGHVPPNSHHPAEAATLYKQLEALIPSTTKLWEIVGHNHVSSSAPSKNWYQAGAGGKSFYSCGTDAIWTYCDAKKVGYLELTISNTDGTTAAKFIN